MAKTNRGKRDETPDFAMTLTQTKALVLQAKDSGEADRFVTFLTAEHGVVNLFARHVRRARSPIAGCVQPFAFLDISYENGKGRSVRQCSVIEPFSYLREDLTLMAYASVIAEIIVQFWPEGEGNSALLEEVLPIFRLMGERNPRLVSLAAGWQLLVQAGFAPELTQCVHCNKKIELPCRFSAAVGGVVCPACATAEAVAMTPEVYELLLKMIGLDFTSPGHFTIVGNQLMQLEKIFLDYLVCHLDRPLKSLAFIHSIA